jgi:hypothetical protein
MKRADEQTLSSNMHVFYEYFAKENIQKRVYD